MDEQKNYDLENEAKETEIIEEPQPAVEEAEKERPEVYDDFSEDFQENEIKEKAPKEVSTKKIIAISSLIATVASVVVMVLGSFLINLSASFITAKQVEGAWQFDLGSYAGSSMKVYMIMDDGDFRLLSSDGMEYFTCGYKRSEDGMIEIVATEEEAMKMNGLLSPGKQSVEYDKKSNTLTMSPGVGGITTWTKATQEETDAVLQAAENYVAPSMEEVPTGDAPAETVPGGDAPAAEVPVQ